MRAVEWAAEELDRLDQIWYDFAGPFGRRLINRRRARQGLPRLRPSYRLRDLIRRPAP